MKILLVEDKQNNIDAAKEQLQGHELTIYKNWKEFMDYEDITPLLQDEFKDEEDKSIIKKQWGEWVQTPFLQNPEKHIEFMKRFDMLLTDINIPGILDWDGTEPEGPLGLLVILRAAEAGIKYIGSITDANHHGDVISKGIDMWASYNRPFILGNSRIMLKSTASVEAKNWKEMYNFLLQN